MTAGSPEPTQGSHPWGPPTPSTGRFGASVPLGGSAPVPVVQERRSDVRTLVVAAMLLVGSVVTIAATLVSWHDYGSALNPDESGWEMADGSLGRAWIALLCAASLAVGGVLLVAGRARAGRLWARIGALALVVFPMVEWAFGDLGTHSGPGSGLWAMLVTGIVLTVAIGTVLPTREPVP